MDFYKKIVKTKDPASVLSEKEYKCVSLQAITNEAIKENNKRRLKELVDEINGHLTDLRTVRDDKDPRNKEKCEKLIKQFEGCLSKIVHNSFSDVLTTINGQLQEFQNLTNVAIRDNNIGELNKLAERMERNLAVVKDIPEVRSARNAENGNETILEALNKYTSLLNKVLAHINDQRRSISGPIHLEIKEESTQEQDTFPSKPNKIALNEVEEKLKLMRQKRLNRLSTFVDQQTKLAEERSRENSPKNSTMPNKSTTENLNPLPDIAENETAIKSIQSPQIIKPSVYKAAAQERLAQAGEQKVFIKTEVKDFKRIEEKAPSGLGGNLGSSFGKGGGLSGPAEKNVAVTAPSTGDSQEKSLPQPVPAERRDAQNEVRKITRNNFEPTKRENFELTRETTAGNRNSFGKSGITKSFAERQIENARNLQIEKPKVQVKHSNSTKTTPPRTPTQIRKVFNSFSSCVLGGNNNKSIEDLSSEFNSPFEQELKQAKLKTTGLAGRLDGPKDGDKPERIKKEYSKMQEPPPLLPPKRNKVPLEKPVVARRTVLQPKQYDEVTVEPKVKRNFRIGVEKSASHSQIIASSKSDQSAISSLDEKKKSWRSSLDYDSVIVRHHEEELVKQEPTGCTITIRRDSNTLEPPTEERCSFSTFRSSSDSIKDENSIDNPVYDVIEVASKDRSVAPEDVSSSTPATKLERQNSVAQDALLISAKTKEPYDFDFSSLVIEENRKKVRRTPYRRELSNDSNKFIVLEPVITKLEYAINVFRGLKRDEDYFWLDKLLSKYYVKVNEVPTNTTFDKIEKNNLLERLKKASKDLESRVTKNEDMLKFVFEDQVTMIGEKYGIA